MDIIRFFGKKLQDKTGKELIACSGMIRLAFKDAGVDSKTLKYEEYKKVFSEHLKNRFQRAGIKNMDKISEYMILELIKNQGLFTMSSE